MMVNRSENSGKSKSLLDDDSLPFDQNAWNAVIEKLDLTPQQARVTELILQGKQNKEIASNMGWRKHTVSAYLRRIFLRAGVDTRLSLAIHICRMARDHIREVGEGGKRSG